jgi:hypothetical protein
MKTLDHWAVTYCICHTNAFGYCRLGRYSPDAPHGTSTRSCKRSTGCCKRHSLPNKEPLRLQGWHQAQSARCATLSVEMCSGDKHERTGKVHGCASLPLHMPMVRVLV